MDNEVSPRRYVIDEIQSQVENTSTRMEVPSTPVIPTRTLPQGAPQSKTWVSSVANPEGEQKTQFAPVRRATKYPDPSSTNTQPSQPWLSQSFHYVSSPQHYDTRTMSSPEPFIPGLVPQSPWSMSPNNQPRNGYAPNQRQNVRSHSLPMAPSHAVEAPPHFYTPQARNVSLSTPPHMAYQSRGHLSQNFSAFPQHQRSQSTSGHTVTQPIPMATLGSPMRQPSLSAPMDAVPTARQTKILEETSRSFVARDPFSVHSGDEEKTEKITFDDMPMSPIPGGWEQHSVYQNPPISWAPTQNPWYQQAPTNLSSVPSSWEQMYSPLMPYPMTPYETRLRSASRSSSSNSDTRSSPVRTTPGYEHVNEMAPQASELSPQRPAQKLPTPEQPSLQEETKADESTTISAIPEPDTGMPIPEGGERDSPLDTPPHSSTTEESSVPGELPEDQAPISGNKGNDPISSQKRSAPIFRTYVSVIPPESRFYGPYTEHPSVDPTDVEPGLYPFYFQEQNVPIEPVVMGKPPEISFSSKLRDFLRWPFYKRTSRSITEFELPYYAYSLPIHHRKPSPTFTDRAVKLIRTTIPHQVYLHFLLRLPSLYFSRVARIFEEAELTLREIKKMALETGLKEKGQVDLHTFESTDVPPQYTKLKSTWEAFIDSVMREWKTFNIISVLLLSAILTILQIQSAAQNVITRYTALSSLMCSLMSLLFGCMYIIRFGTMRKTYKAAEWALEARQTRTTVWWNVWVLLAMPAIWLTWSIVLYIVCIMSFVWQASADTDQNPPSHISARTLLAVRITISTVLGLGVVYGMLILSTFRRYGQVMDNAWQRRINNWITEKRLGSRSYYNHPARGFEPWPQNSMHGSRPSANLQSDQRPFTSSPYGGYGAQGVFLYPSPPPPAAYFGPPPPPPPPVIPLFFEPYPTTFQIPDTTYDPPISSPIKLPQFSYAGVGHFSDLKDLIEEVPLSFFVPPITEKQRSEDLNAFADGDQSATKTSTLPHIAVSSTSHQDIGPPINQDGDDLHTKIDSESQEEKTSESENHATRNVRIRSPLVSPEVAQFESSISGNDRKPILSNPSDDNLSNSAILPTNILDINQPESSTSIPLSKIP